MAPAEGVSFCLGGNNVLLVAVDEAHAERVEGAVKAGRDEVLQRSGGQKRSMTVCSWPCRQLV